MSDPPLLQVERLRVRYRLRDGSQVPAVSDVSFTLARGDCLALVGESGSGKSATALTLMGLAGPAGQVEGSRILFEGTGLAGAPPGRLAPPAWQPRGHGFQDAMSALDPIVRIGNQVAEGFRIHQALTRRAALARVAELLDSVGIPDPPAVPGPTRHDFQKNGAPRRAGAARRRSPAPGLARRPA